MLVRVREGEGEEGVDPLSGPRTVGFAPERKLMLSAVMRAEMSVAEDSWYIECRAKDPRCFRARFWTAIWVD